MAERKNSLRWFPSDPSRWLTDPNVLRMTPEQIGAWWLLTLVAWGDGTKEPSLPADDESLAFLSRMGDRWRTSGAPLRAMLTEQHGRLVNVTWTELWHAQQAKYSAAARKGGVGGARKAENARKLRKGGSSATAQLHEEPRPRATVNPSKPEPVSSAIAQLQLSSSPTVALEGSVLQNLGADGAPADGGALAAPSPQYELAIGAKVEEYRRLHPEEAERLESDVRAELRVSRRRLLSRDEQHLVHRRMVEVLEQSRAAGGGSP